MEIPTYFIYIAVFLLLIPMLGTVLAMVVGVLSYVDANRKPAAGSELLTAFIASLRTVARQLGHTVAEVSPGGAAVIGDRPAAAEHRERRTRHRRRHERRQNERRLQARDTEDRRRLDRRRSDRRGAA